MTFKEHWKFNPYMYIQQMELKNKSHQEMLISLQQLLRWSDRDGTEETRVGLRTAISIVLDRMGSNH